MGLRVKVIHRMALQVAVIHRPQNCSGDHGMDPENLTHDRSKAF
jgi:hypothetical protein